jgi:crotonobetainyl-CoA:carnitine CoA-transferase CaiB-like acyl-CoA transferase
MTRQTSKPGPLNGVRVLELGTLIAAPFAARLLGDFGADVIKVEAHDGDPLRKWRKMKNGTSLWWYVQSRNKRLMTLNLKSDGGRAIARRLIERTDVLVENFRPGTLEKLGLDWEVLRAINPKLILVRISGYGQTGPWRDKPGFGSIGEAMGGIRYTTGEPDRPPSRAGISLGDSLASLHAVVGALIALLRVKTRQGDGQVVDVALFESVFNIMESLIPEYDVLGHVRERSGGKLPGICPSDTYKTADNHWIVIAGNGDTIFKRLMHVIERPDLADDPRLKTNDGRVAHEEEVDSAISSWLRGKSLSEALECLDGADVPSGRIYSAEDIVGNIQYRDRQIILDEVLPDGSSVKMPGIIPKLSETPGEVRWIGRSLGADTREILAELNFSRDEIDHFEAQRAI